jgi:tRNA1(Val) A37 N6-methylase TrmN6
MRSNLKRLILIQVKVNMSYIKGDIHEVIKTIKTDSIDLIYTNPPFGITKKKWDTPLNWDEL